MIFPNPDTKLLNEFVKLIRIATETLEELPITRPGRPFEHWPLRIFEELRRVSKELKLADSPVFVGSFDTLYLHSLQGGLVPIELSPISDDESEDLSLASVPRETIPMTKEVIEETITVLKQWERTASYALPSTSDDFLRVNEAAKLLDIKPYEITRLWKAEKVRVHKDSSGHRTVAVKDVAYQVLLKKRFNEKPQKNESEADVEKQFNKASKNSKA